MDPASGGWPAASTAPACIMRGQRSFSAGAARRASLKLFDFFGFTVIYFGAERFGRGTISAHAYLVQLGVARRVGFILRSYENLYGTSAFLRIRTTHIGELQLLPISIGHPSPTRILAPSAMVA